MREILVLHGPNLNALGKREPEFYGQTTLDELNKGLIEKATAAGFRLEARQSHYEGQLIEWIYQAGELAEPPFLIFNPAALTHSSIALRDALIATDLPFIEVHISQIQARESFRHCSYFTDIAQGLISGMGVKGYFLALQFIIEQ